MTYAEIKKRIRKHYNLFTNTKILLNPSEMTFRMNMGESLSMDIKYPIDVIRELKLEKILND